MDFIERRVRSAPNLSHEDALESLQAHPNYRSGTKITSFRRRGERWVAVLHVPKTAGEFPPEGDDEGEGPPPPKKEAPKDDEGPEDSSGPPPFDDEGPEGPPKEDGPPEKGKGGTEGEILHVLTEILHALKGGPVGPGLGGPDDLGPGGPPPGGPPPPHPGGPAGAGGKPPSGAAAKLRPGEIANKPGVIPVGAPAFSSTNPLAKRLAKIAGRKRHIPVSSPAGVSIKEAKAELDPIAEYFGYRVAQVRYCGENCSCKSPGSSKIHALLEIGG